jgi:hypothetical protein
MLKHKTIIFHLRRKSMSNVYISASEMDDLIQSLNSTELRLYSLVFNSILQNPTIEYFSDQSLAAALSQAVSSVKNAKSGLKQKGYLLLVKFKDERNFPCLRVIIGKDQVALYNMGITAEVTNPKAFNKLFSQFKLNDPTLSHDEKAQKVTEFNEYYKEHRAEFE